MSLTRLVLRERALLENRPRGMSGALVEHLVPLQERLDDWRRAIAALDKEGARGALSSPSPFSTRSPSPLLFSIFCVLRLLVDSRLLVSSTTRRLLLRDS